MNASVSKYRRDTTNSIKCIEKSGSNPWYFSYPKLNGYNIVGISPNFQLIENVFLFIAHTTSHTKVETNSRVSTIAEWSNFLWNALSGYWLYMRVTNLLIVSSFKAFIILRFS